MQTALLIEKKQQLVSKMKNQSFIWLIYTRLKGFYEIYNFAVKTNPKFRRKDWKNWQKQKPKTCDANSRPKIADFGGLGGRQAQAGCFYWMRVVVSFPKSTKMSNSDSVCKIYACFTEGVSKQTRIRFGLNWNCYNFWFHGPNFLKKNLEACGCMKKGSTNFYSIWRRFDRLFKFRNRWTLSFWFSFLLSCFFFSLLSLSLSLVLRQNESNLFSYLLRNRIQTLSFSLPSLAQPKSTWPFMFRPKSIFCLHNWTQRRQQRLIAVETRWVIRGREGLWWQAFGCCDNQKAAATTVCGCHSKE